MTMEKDLMEYLDLTYQAVWFLEKKDSFSFEKTILKRQGVIDKIKKYPGLKKHLKEYRDEIESANKTLEEKSDELMSEIKKELKNIKDNKHLNKYEKNSLMEGVENKINLSS